MTQMAFDQMAERWLIVDNRPLFLREAGQGAPIIHVHGFASSGKYMSPTALALADGSRNLVPDLPGFGRSIDPPATLSIEELGDALVGLMDILGIPEAVLLGNSLGASIICGFALRHPDRITHAILVSPAGGEHNTPLLRAVGQLSRDALREPLGLARVSAPEYLRFGVCGMLRLFTEMTRFPARTALQNLDVPTLVIMGTRDPVLPGWDRIRTVTAGMHNQVHLAVIRGAAHAINFSHPQAVAALTSAFLAGQLNTGVQELGGNQIMVAHRRAEDS